MTVSDSGDWSPPAFVPPALHGSIRDRIEAGTHFRVEGRGPAVVLVHGVGLDLEMWEAQARALQDRYTVIRYDMLCHGASAKPPGDLRLQSFVAQLEMLHDYFKLGRFALIGFSMGALIAQAYALVRPQSLTGLVLMNSVHDRTAAQREAVLSRLRQAERDGPSSIIDAALTRWLSEPFRADNPETVASIRHRLESNDPRGFLAAYRIFAMAEAIQAERLQDIGCPTLVMTGARDSGSTPAMSETMAAAIPNAQCRILPDLMHLAPIEGAAAVNAALAGFLDGLQVDAAPNA